jgi:predicted nucleotidyltransferase
MASNNKPVAAPMYLGVAVPMRAIRGYARQIAERFHPDRIILFGSYAYGTPNADSDVDLLVVMPCRNELDMSVKITWELPAPFAMDLLVRKPEQWNWRIKEGESFSTQILTKGKVLYAKGDARVGEKGRVRSPRRRRPRSGFRAVRR